MFRVYNDGPRTAQIVSRPLTSMFMIVTYVRLVSFPALSAAEGSVGIVQRRALAVDGQRPRPKRWKQILGIKRPGSGHEHPANYDPFRWPLALETDPFRFTSQPSGAPSTNPTASPTKRPTPGPTPAPTSSTSSPTTYRWIPDKPTACPTFPTVLWVSVRRPRTTLHRAKEFGATMGAECGSRLWCDSRR